MQFFAKAGKDPFRLLPLVAATFPKGTAELPQSKPDGFASSLWEGAIGMVAKFPAKAESLRACPLPLGGAVAQRLRGFKWRSEKSVKAIAPTGAALAFLCFDFFFRIVKGE